jgi:hypothetical protein
MSKTHVLYLSIAPGTLKDLVRWTGFNKHVPNMETCPARPLIY